MGNIRKLIVTLVPFTLFVMLALMAGRARASEARMAALSDNPMVLDMVNVVDFPGLLTVYGNSAFLNVYPNIPDGNVGAFFGEDIVLGAWVHRDAEWDDLAVTEDAYNLNLPDTFDLFDFYFGIKQGFGIRLTLSAGLDTTDTQTEADDSDLYSDDGASTLAFDLMLGYSLDKATYHGDFGVGITFSHFQTAADGEPSTTTRWIPSFLIRHRSIIGEREAVVSGVIDVDVTRRAYSAKTEGNIEDEGSFGRWVVSLVGGPQFRMPHNFTVWPGLRFELEHLSGKVDGDEQQTMIGIGAPGLVLAAELILWEMLAIRVGVDYDIYWTLAEQPDPIDDDEVIQRDREMGQRFNWSSGLGLALGDFQLDATISQRLYFNGPAIIGGGDPGFLGIISAGYEW